MWRFVAAMLAMVMSFGAIIAPNENGKNFLESNPIVASAYSTGNYKVATSSGVNVRSGAGTGYSKKGSAANGTTFTVSQISGSWGYTSSIKCTNGTKSGWVCLNYCSQITSSFVSGTYKVYNCSTLNVRKGAGTSYGVKTTVKAGTYLYITSKSGNWGYAQNKGGYVSMKYCTFVSKSDLTSTSSSSSSSSSTSYSTPLSSGTKYYIYPKCASNKVLDVNGLGTANGTNIMICNLNGGKNQQFKAVLVSSGYYAFYDTNSGKVIDVSGGVVANGTNVQLYKYNGTASQLWRLISVGDGYYMLQSKLNKSYYLDICGGTDTNGANVQLCKGNSTNAQKFKFVSVSSSTSTSLGISSYSSEYKNSTYYTKLVNATRTGANRQTVANIALSQVGYHEGSYAGTSSGSNNKCEYNRWYYNSNSAYGSNYAWCAVFTTWCMREAGVSTSVYNAKYLESVSSIKNWFTDRSRYYSYSSYTPKVGDIAIFSSSSHVGIVVGVSGSGKSAKVTIVAGNDSNQVRKFTITNDNVNHGNGSVKGYCVPNY